MRLVCELWDTNSHSVWCPRLARSCGFNNPLHTSTFFPHIHLSLSSSCCAVLACVKQLCFDFGKGGFPQGYSSFFHANNYPCTGNHATTAWTQKHVWLSCRVLFIFIVCLRTMVKKYSSRREMHLLKMQQDVTLLSSHWQMRWLSSISARVKGGAVLLRSILNIEGVVGIITDPHGGRAECAMPFFGGAY